MPYMYFLLRGRANQSRPVPRDWLRHHRILLYYKPTGKINRGRPRKRWKGQL
jgi:hypothetical protein